MYLNEGAKFQFQQAAELGNFGHMALDLESRYKKKLEESPSSGKESH